MQQKDEEQANAKQQVRRRRKRTSKDLSKITVTSWEVNSITSLNPMMTLLEEIPYREWSLFSRSIGYHLQLMCLKGLGQKPLYGQHKSSYEFINAGQKPLYLDLSQLIISWVPVSKGQRWKNITHKGTLFPKQDFKETWLLNKSSSIAQSWHWKLTHQMEKVI